MKTIYFKICGGCCGRHMQEGRKFEKILNDNNIPNDFGIWEDSSQSLKEVYKLHNISDMFGCYIYFPELKMMVPCSAMHDKQLINILKRYSDNELVKTQPKPLEEGQYRFEIIVENNRQIHRLTRMIRNEEGKLIEQVKILKDEDITQDEIDKLKSNIKN